uniref:Peptidase A2 domain-containing protein n=1 Tax=Peronospora matthiolae TaxID=2874970 RepID=A0AAV1TUQ3_9STRA
MELYITPGELRGYWKYHTPGKWFKQAKAVDKINNEKATFLFDSGAEISIIDTTFARKEGCVMDENQTQECVGIGESTCMTVGRTKIKTTLNGSLVYNFDVWVGDEVGQEAILGIYSMFPAGICLDLAIGTLCLPDEVRICLAKRRPP